MAELRTRGHAQAQGRRLVLRVLRGLGGGHGHVPFEKSRFYSAFQAEYPGRVGLDIFPFIPPLACVNDPAHLGLSLCAKGARDTVVAFRAARVAGRHGRDEAALCASPRLASRGPRTVQNL